MTTPRLLASLAAAVTAGALGASAVVVSTPAQHPATASPSARTVAQPDAGSSQAVNAVRAASTGTLSDTARTRTTLRGSTLFGSSAASAVATGSIDFRVSEGELSLSVSGTGATIPQIFYPSVVLVRPPPTGSSLPPPAKPWVAATFSDVAVESTNRNFPDFISQLESTNPALLVSELAWGATTATAAGREVVNGAAATRYDVTVDLSRALTQATGPARAPFSLALDAEVSHLRDSGTASVIADAWVDDAGRLVRVEESPPVPGVGTVAVTLSDFSQAVTIDPPTADRVVTLGSLSPSGERENRNGGDTDGG